jgi:uncharacterized protein
MLLRFEVENFGSIRDRQVMDLRLPNTSPDLPERFAHPLGDRDVRVPKVSAIFGPNASGKTTIISALSFVEWFVGNSFRLGLSQEIPANPFGLFSSSEDILTCFLVELAIRHSQAEVPRIYKYELKIGHSLKENFVAYEKLSSSPHGKFRTLFERHGNHTESVVKVFKGFGVEPNDPRLSVRTNVSVISSLAQFAHPFSTCLIKHLSTITSNVFIVKNENKEDVSTESYVVDQRILEKLNHAIKIVDLGIESVVLAELQGRKMPFFSHANFKHPFTYFFESQGTKNFYYLFPYIARALLDGGIALMDEIDSDIHPMLMPEIIRWFHDPVENPHGAQLIMSCHNATLLEYLEKEEVWFTEKDQTGATSLYPLRDISGVRRDANIYKKYLGGTFGAVPRIG